jgi:streptomycin 6-kinase
MHRRGAEDEALDRIADVARALHAGHVPTAATVPLERWFAALQRVAAWRGGWWRVAWAHAESLLASPRDDVPLHGDLHHGNVLRFEGAGWRAIDPKALRGDPAFEFAAPLLNPERVTPGSDPTVLRARALRLAVRSGQEVGRVLAWTEAFASLSAAWAVEEGGDPAVDLAWWRLARAARAGG